jgi:hypothetical protein
VSASFFSAYVYVYSSTSSKGFCGIRARYHFLVLSVPFGSVFKVVVDFRPGTSCDLHYI